MKRLHGFAIWGLLLGISVTLLAIAYTLPGTMASLSDSASGDAQFVSGTWAFPVTPTTTPSQTPTPTGTPTLNPDDCTYLPDYWRQHPDL